MSKVTIDPTRLRAGATALSATEQDPRGRRFGPGDLGAVQSDAAFEEFAAYWTTGRSAVTQSSDALVTVLRSAADAYTSRDAVDTRQFAGGVHAF
jgi:hypothetical protein